MNKFRAALALLPLLVIAAGCTSKSSNPLSPSVAGPIPGVDISAPKVLEPAAGWQIDGTKQPLTLLVENALSNGVRPLTYAFDVASDAGFTNKVFTRAAVAQGEGGRTSLRLPDPLTAGRTYYWRARAEDGANTGPFSAAAHFELYIPIVIGEPGPVSPVGNTTVPNTHPRFTFRNAPTSGPIGAVSYTVEISTNDTFSSKVAIWTVAQQASETSLDAPADLSFGQQYFWHVRAFDQTAAGPWSSTQSFSTPSRSIAPPGGVPSTPGKPCGPPYPNNGLAVVACVSAKYPERLVAGISVGQRMANMEFLRDRIIETGLCGGMNLAWNLKRGGPTLSTDAIVWRHDGIDELIDIGFAYDDASQPLQLVWHISIFPYYKPYPAPAC